MLKNDIDDQNVLLVTVLPEESEKSTRRNLRIKKNEAKE
jgi:hypothetical protein